MKSTVNGETSEERERERKFYRVIEKRMNLPKANETGPSTSSPRQTQPEEDRIEIDAPKPAETELMSSHSEFTIAVHRCLIFEYRTV